MARTIDDARTHARALRILRLGLASVADVAKLADTSRQRVQHWADAAGIDPVATRAKYLARLWARDTRGGGGK